jgi:class 3 adenylate cyclase/tetratricopeptide (TPR) repeat protein
MAVSSMAGSVRLRPYVPRLVIEWLRDSPDLSHRQIEGSLAFVDISGFTNLTERLSRRGKVGAEEMNQILNDRFTECLSSAYGFGASVIKWGGDAVLLLFEGEHHERRACRAAFEMQRTMRRVGRIRTGSGSVTLRMSIGIHSGLLDFFLVGHLHRELVVTGLAATRTVAMESVADAGEIAISPETAAALDPRDLGEQKETAVLLRRGPEVSGERGEWVEGVEGLDLASCIPMTVREHLLADATEPEHRLMTAAFVHVMGADDLLAGAGPDTLASALTATLDTLERVALDHGVAFFDTDIYLGGSKVMLMAGAPISTGTDEERMLRTLRAVLDTDLPLPLRVGITRGRIFVGDFGPDYRRTYTVTGDSVNLAARLMAKAQPGQILVAGDVVERSRTRFDVTALEPFAVKGKDEPVEAFELGRALGASTVETEQAPLVGREEELAVLLSGLESLRAGSGAIVDLVGEPGLGKSRLVEELRRHAGDLRLLSVESDEYASSTAYDAFRTLLHDLLGVSGAESATNAETALRICVESRAPHLMPWLPLLGTPLGLELEETRETALLDERFRRDRVHEVTAELLGMLLLEPTVLAFEDAHWMDDASAELLRHLITQIELRPWMVVVTRRKQDSGFVPPDGSGVVRIDLVPLGPEAANALLTASTEEMPLLPHELEALATRSGGNPLFLAELVAAARDAGGIESLPDSVESLLMAQIDRLAPADRRLLRRAAVIGAVFSTDLLAETMDEVADAAGWARLADFLHDQGDGQFRFRHALVRDAAYEGLSYRRRRELHSAVGLTIERNAKERDDDESELLSLHFFHARNFEKAWRYSRLAGERAAAIYANVEAAAFYERALASVRRIRPVQVDEVAALAEMLGDVRIRLNEFEHARRAYRIARRRGDDEPVAQTRLLIKEGEIPYRLGRGPQALRWFNRALRTLDGNDSADATTQRARLFVWCAMVRIEQHRPKEAVEWCRRAIDEAERVGARDVLAHAYHVLDWAYLGLGRPDEAVYSGRAIAIHEELGDLDRLAAALNNLGIRAYLEGRWDEALELIERSRQTCETVGDRARASLAAMNIGDYLLDQGRLEEAEPILRDVLRIWRAAGSQIDVAEAASLLGRLKTRAGRFEQARALLEEARALSECEGDEVRILIADVWLAECLLMEGESNSAVSLADGTLQRARAMRGVSVLVAALHRLRGLVFVELGEVDQARAAFEESLRSARLPDANLPMRSTDYEVALTLDAIANLARALGESTDGFVLERDEILDRLGVVKIPESPLGRVSIESRE